MNGGLLKNYLMARRKPQPEKPVPVGGMQPVVKPGLMSKMTNNKRWWNNGR